MEQFLKELASKEPVPGGGGAAALTGSVAAALASMVANLTTGKKKYAEYQQDIERILEILEVEIKEIYGYIAKDAEAFLPLAEAYSIPKEDPKREEILEKVSLQAALIPMELTEKLFHLIPILEELETKGSRLAISDVAVAASCLRAALESSVMNIYINTGSLKDRKKAEELNQKAKELVEEGAKRCQEIYDNILKFLLS